jgi:hypothetical protein
MADDQLLQQQHFQQHVSQEREDILLNIEVGLVFFCLSCRSCGWTLQIVERQIDDMCARDEFEKAEQLDVELQRLKERLKLVAAIANDGVGDEDEEDVPTEQLSETVDTPLAARRASRKLQSTGAPASPLVAQRALAAAGARIELGRGSGAWQDIPLTPQPDSKRVHVNPAAQQNADAALAAILYPVREALSNQRVLDTIFSFLAPEELGRLCGVSRLWRERIEQDEIWQPLYKSEWQVQCLFFFFFFAQDRSIPDSSPLQHEINPSPGTFKRWYGAMRSAPISWQNPILQQETVRHESLCGRVELRTFGQVSHSIAVTQ